MSVETEAEVDETEDVLDLSQQAPEETLDLTSGDGNGFKEVPYRSVEWATVVRPFGVLIFLLVTSVVLAPFIVVLLLPDLDPTSRSDSIVNWGTHVLAPVVGFASAVITYYFGTQASNRNGNG